MGVGAPDRAPSSRRARQRRRAAAWHYCTRRAARLVYDHAAATIPSCQATAVDVDTARTGSNIPVATYHAVHMYAHMLPYEQPRAAGRATPTLSGAYR